MVAALDAAMAPEKPTSTRASRPKKPPRGKLPKSVRRKLKNSGWEGCAAKVAAAMSGEAPPPDRYVVDVLETPAEIDDRLRCQLNETPDDETGGHLIIVTPLPRLVMASRPEMFAMMMVLTVVNALVPPAQRVFRRPQGGGTWTSCLRQLLEMSDIGPAAKHAMHSLVAFGDCDAWSGLDKKVHVSSFMAVLRRMDPELCQKISAGGQRTCIRCTTVLKAKVRAVRCLQCDDLLFCSRECRDKAWWHAASPQCNRSAREKGDTQREFDDEETDDDKWVRLIPSCTPVVGCQMAKVAKRGFSLVHHTSTEEARKRARHVDLLACATWRVMAEAPAQERQTGEYKAQRVGFALQSPATRLWGEDQNNHHGPRVSHPVLSTAQRLVLEQRFTEMATADAASRAANSTPEPAVAVYDPPVMAIVAAVIAATWNDEPAEVATTLVIVSAAWRSTK